MKYYSGFAEIKKALNCTEYRARDIFRQSKALSEEKGIRTFKSKVYNGVINDHLGIDIFQTKKRP